MNNQSKFHSSNARRVRMLLLCFSLVSLYACSDDSSKNKSDTVPDSPELAAIGEPCSAEHACSSDLFCEESVCIAHVQLNDACDALHICPDDLECKSGICKEIPAPEPQCDDEHPCPPQCSGDGCPKTVAIGEACTEDDICTDSTCIHNICSVYVEGDEECAPEQGRLCKDEMLCSEQGKCYLPGNLGDDCNILDPSCESGLVCHEELGKCMYLGKLGDDCNLQNNLACDSELVCIDEKCRKYSEDNCSELEPCMSESAVCYDGKCIESNPCTSDSGCQSDMYCCLEEGCKIKKICLPYGIGPRLNVNDSCQYETISGVFEADIQCEWLGPAENELYPESKNVSQAVMVAPTPHETGHANTLFVLSYAKDPKTQPVIRLLNGENCTLLESIYDEKHVISPSGALSLADVDGDGVVEIFAHRSTMAGDEKGGIVAFKWSEKDKKYIYSWHNSDLVHNDFQCASNHGCEGIYSFRIIHNASIHDINNDNIPELITPYGEVLNAVTGEKLNGDQAFESTVDFPVLGDLDKDGKIEYIDYEGTVYEWDIQLDSENKVISQQWVEDYPKADSVVASYTQHQKAFADFGTPGETSDSFDWTKKDGIAEIVANTPAEGNNKGTLAIYALVSQKNADNSIVKKQQKILELSGLYGGGFPTIGDFDSDGMPEIGVAFGDHYRVIDPECSHDTDTKCKSKYILWEGYNQDKSSYSTGSSIFDFDGDGQSEVVYADECFARIYDGKTGDILFSSHHTNTTGKEYPVIADVDNDGSAEIVIPETMLSHKCLDVIDASHRGIRCTDNNECTSGICEDGFCRCTDADQCNWRKGGDGAVKKEYTCADPIAEDKAVNPKKICRAQHPTEQSGGGIKVLRERYDRWVSARPIWNQYSYSITNINDDMTIPKTSDWKQNFQDPTLNNYRANAQGSVGHNTAPDITSKLMKDNVCVISGTKKITLNGVICNRGTKMVAAKLPASFYRVEEDGTLGNKYCTSYTTENVPVGGCLPVSCEVTEEQLSNVTIRMIANDDGEKGKTTVECNSENNTDQIVIENCAVN